jgi:hypothetical protein
MSIMAFEKGGEFMGEAGECNGFPDVRRVIMELAGSNGPLAFSKQNRSFFGDESPRCLRVSPTGHDPAVAGGEDRCRRG